MKIIEKIRNLFSKEKDSLLKNIKWKEFKEVLISTSDNIGKSYMFGTITSIKKQLNNYNIEVSINDRTAIYVVTVSADSVENHSIVLLEDIYRKNITLILKDDIRRSFLETILQQTIDDLEIERDKHLQCIYNEDALEILKKNRDLQSLIDYVIQKEGNNFSKEYIPYYDRKDLIKKYDDRISEIRKIKYQCNMFILVKESVNNDKT